MRAYTNQKSYADVVAAYYEIKASHIRKIIPVTEDVPEAIRISEDCEDEYE